MGCDLGWSPCWGCSSCVQHKCFGTVKIYIRITVSVIYALLIIACDPLSLSHTYLPKTNKQTLMDYSMQLVVMFWHVSNFLPLIFSYLAFFIQLSSFVFSWGRRENPRSGCFCDWFLWVEVSWCLLLWRQFSGAKSFPLIKVWVWIQPL